MDNKIYIFKKSGSLVKIISTTRIGNKQGYIVERIDSGKQFFVLKKALLELKNVSEDNLNG